MTTPHESTPELTAEALGDVPGRGRLAGPHILVVGAGSLRFQGRVILVGMGKLSHAWWPERVLRVICADSNLAAALAQGIIPQEEEDAQRSLRRLWHRCPHFCFQP